MTYRALPGRPASRAPGGRHRSKPRIAVVVLALSAAVLATAGPALGDPSAIASKKAEVQHVLGEIQDLDVSLDQAVEAYNVATEKLNAIQADLRTNLRELNIARTNYERSQRVLSARLISLYTTGDETSTLGILLGAGSISDLLGRFETVNRVSAQDAEIHRQIVSFKREMKQRRVQLKQQRATQRDVVAERAAHQASIEDQLAERKRLVASIQSEIERLKREEEARQRELARQARERQLAAAAAPAPTIVTTPTETPSETAVAPPPGNYAGVVAIAMRYLGVPYVYGGASPSGFDCSGFVMYVFAQVGISLPHGSTEQYAYGTHVSISQLQPGDLVFFYSGLSHNGIYIGGGQFIHAPHTGDVVKISELAGHYTSVFAGATRL